MSKKRQTSDCKNAQDCRDCKDCKNTKNSSTQNCDGKSKQSANG